VYRRAVRHSAGKELFGVVYLSHRVHHLKSCHPRKPLLGHVQSNILPKKVSHFITDPYTY